MALTNQEPLTSVDFSEVTITMDGNQGKQAVGSSGTRAYTRLPVFNGTDLDTFCPGGPKSNIYVTDDLPKDTGDTTSPAPPVPAATTAKNTEAKNTEESFPGWGIALVVIFGVGAILASGFIVYMAKKERKGEPVFAKKSSEQIA